MISLHKESKKFTTFLTEWGMYRYKRMPNGIAHGGPCVYGCLQLQV